MAWMACSSSRKNQWVKWVDSLKLVAMAIVVLATLVVLWFYEWFFWIGENGANLSIFDFYMTEKLQTKGIGEGDWKKSVNTTCLWE